MATVKENITNALTWFYERLKSNDLDPMQEQIDELNTNLDDISNNLPSMIQRGTVTLNTVNGSTYSDTDVTFSKTFPGTPFIVVSLSSTNTGSAYGNIAFTTVNRSTTGFTIRALNDNSGNYSASVTWIAIY